MPRIVVSLFLCFFAFISEAQFKSAVIGIDGLTCSMCSNSVEKLMRQLDFVRDVKMDLNSTTAEVIFYEDKKVNIHDLAKKVFDAGFSVRKVQAVYVQPEGIEVKEGSSYIYEGDEYIFIKTSEQKMTGETILTFIGASYMSKKEFSHWKGSIAKYKGTVKGKAKVYYITL